MAARKKTFPPLENRHTIIKRRLSRLFVNLLVLLGAGVLYYVVFSFLFDTPQEHKVRKSTDELRREYAALAERLGQIEEVIDNVEERDRNVFGILFESEPYVLDEYAASHWDRMEQLLAAGNLPSRTYRRPRTRPRQARRLFRHHTHTDHGAGRNPGCHSRHTTRH